MTWTATGILTGWIDRYVLRSLGYVINISTMPFWTSTLRNTRSKLYMISLTGYTILGNSKIIHNGILFNQWNKLPRKNNWQHIWILTSWFIFQLKPCECMEKTISQCRNAFTKIYFYCLWLFVNRENWCGVPQDFHQCLYNTFAMSKERALLYLPGKGQKSAFLRVLASFWL